MAGRTDSASRVVAAAPAVVYAALVDPEAWLRWLPPDGMTATVQEFDLRVGGSYRMTLAYDDPTGAPGKSSAGTDVVRGRFVEVVSGERLVQEVDFVSDDPSYAGTMRMTWSVTPTAEGTEVTFRADDVPPGISAEDHARGLAASLANLAAYLEWGTAR